MRPTFGTDEYVHDAGRAQARRKAAMSPTTPPSPVRRRPRSAHRARFLRQRELSGSGKTPPALLSWIEGETLRKLDTGNYVDLGKSSHLVRSTISIAFSHDDRFFASTHGDHSVKIFEYPSCKQICSLDGHPRTPWSVRFHPRDSSIVASGCLGGECRIWNIAQRKCIRKHTFRSLISCVAFHPSGEFLAVVSGRQLLLWTYGEATRGGSIFTRCPPEGIADPAPPPPAGFANDIQPPGMPVQLFELADDKKVYKLVDFHPSGRMLMTGVSNRILIPPARQREDGQVEDEQFTVRLVVHHFDRRTGINFPSPVLTIPHAVAYNDAGTHFSPCGTMLVACVPVTEHKKDFQIAVLSLTNSPRARPIGSVLYSTPLDKGHVTALTNLKFSSTSQHLLAGFSFRPQNPVLRAHAEQFEENAALSFADRRLQPRRAPCGAPVNEPHPQVRVVDIYRVNKSFPKIRSLGADVDVTEQNIGGAEDEINVAVFAPSRGVADGILYGTQKGRIRKFQHASRRKALPPGICDDNCKFRRAHSLRSLLNPPYSAQPPNPAPIPAQMPISVPAVTWARYAAFAAAAAANASSMPAQGPRPADPALLPPVRLPRITLPMPPEHPPNAYAAPIATLAGELRTQVFAQALRRRQSQPAAPGQHAQNAPAGNPTPAPPALPPIIFERPAQSHSRRDRV